MEKLRLDVALVDDKDKLTEQIERNFGDRSQAKVARLIGVNPNEITRRKLGNRGFSSWSSAAFSLFFAFIELSRKLKEQGIELEVNFLDNDLIKNAKQNIIK